MTTHDVKPWNDAAADTWTGVIHTTSQPDMLRFYAGGKEAFRVTADRQFILADDMSLQDVAREFAQLMREYLEKTP